LEDILTAKVLEQDISTLRAATGSEVVDVVLHLQMEAARRRTLTKNSHDIADAFIESHVEDASPAEKLAMKMIPMQLPTPASTQLSQPTKDAHKERIRSSQRLAPSKTKKTNSNLLSRQEEIELSRIIREGAKLQALKSDFEAHSGREITRAEWTSLADLDSPSTLRRLISSYRQAKHKLVLANMGLVYAVVRQHPLVRRDRSREEELVQEGSLGLLRAAELFDPERGLRFSTYATIWIKGVLSSVKENDLIRIPEREMRKWNKVQKAKKEVLAMGDNDVVGQIAERVGIEREEVVVLEEKMKQMKYVMSLDQTFTTHTRGGGEVKTLSTQTPLHSDRSLLSDDSLSEIMQLKADVVAALAKNLDPREARLMRLRYGLKDGKMRTMVECAEAMGLSRQRVQQLAKQCLEKLRQAEDVGSLQEYLLTVA
jgi:RNA polymerase primary sigma factor